VRPRFDLGVVWGLLLLPFLFVLVVLFFAGLAVVAPVYNWWVVKKYGRCR